MEPKLYSQFLVAPYKDLRNSFEIPGGGLAHIGVSNGSPHYVLRVSVDLIRIEGAPDSASEEQK